MPRPRYRYRRQCWGGVASRISVPDVVRVLEDLAEQFPDRVDERHRPKTTRYVVHGQPYWLVAVVMYRLGISIAGSTRSAPVGPRL